MAPTKKQAAKNDGRELFVVEVAAETPDGMIHPGEIAEAGAAILVKYPLLFIPLTITYQA